MFEHLITRDGKRSSTKSLTLACWVIATIWGCIELYHGKLSDEFVGLYLGAFVLNQMASTATSAYKSRVTTSYDRPRQVVDDPDRR